MTDEVANPVLEATGDELAAASEAALPAEPEMAPSTGAEEPAVDEPAAAVAPEPAAEVELKTFAKRSVALFLGGVLVICIFGFFDDIRPTVASEDGGTEPLAVTPIIQMVMLTAAALIMITCKVKATDVPSMSIFKAGMVAMIALFGIAWMADTFIANNEDAIVSALGDLANQWPFMIAVSIFLVAALTTSQSAATRTMVPLGLALGIGAGYTAAEADRAARLEVIQRLQTQIAAVEADRAARLDKLLRQDAAIQKLQAELTQARASLWSRARRRLRSTLVSPWHR